MPQRKKIVFIFNNNKEPIYSEFYDNIEIKFIKTYVRDITGLENFNMFLGGTKLNNENVKLKQLFNLNNNLNNNKFIIIQIIVQNNSNNINEINLLNSKIDQLKLENEKLKNSLNLLETRKNNMTKNQKNFLILKEKYKTLYDLEKITTNKLKENVRVLISEKNTILQEYYKLNKKIDKYIKQSFDEIKYENIINFQLLSKNSFSQNNSNFPTIEISSYSQLNNNINNNNNNETLDLNENENLNNSFNKIISINSNRLKKSSSVKCIFNKNNSENEKTIENNSLSEQQFESNIEKSSSASNLLNIKFQLKDNNDLILFENNCDLLFKNEIYNSNFNIKNNIQPKNLLLNQFFNVFKYLNEDDIINFSLSNRKYGKNYIYFLFNYIEYKIENIHFYQNKLKEKYNNYFNNIKFDFDNFTNNSFKILSSSNYKDVYLKNESFDFFKKNENLIEIYRIFFQFTKIFNNNLTLPKETFISTFLREIKQNLNKINLGDYIKNLMSNKLDFSFDNILNVYKILNKYQINKINTVQISKNCKTTGIISFLIQNLLNFSGLILNEKNKNEDFLNKNKIFYKFIEYENKIINYEKVYVKLNNNIHKFYIN